MSRWARLLAAALIWGSGIAAPASAQVSDQPPTVSVYTLTAERIAASGAAVVGLIGAVIGGLALARSAGRVDVGNGRRGAIVALVMGADRPGHRWRGRGHGRRWSRHRQWAGWGEKRTFALILAALAAAALFGGLVHAVLVAAHVSEPAATTVYGLTPRRLWATTAAVLALVGVVIGGLALARPASRFGTASGRLGAIVALVAGLIAVVNGGLNLAIANGGPGTGNGVVGGAGALVLGLIAMALGGLALARSRRTA